MGLHPGWRSVLPPGKQVPLSPGLLSVDYDAEGDEAECELVHKISARESFDPGGLY